MSRLANPEASELSETRALRDRRDHLLRKADRARYRLHCRPDLTKELQQATNDLLRLEIEARAQAQLRSQIRPQTHSQAQQRPQSIPEPLGDARPAAVSPFQSRLPYKD